MAYSIPRDQVVKYTPEAIWTFEVYGYEWIDDLWFTHPPSDFLGDRAGEYVAVARQRFLQAGWEGDGEIVLLWIPPFVFPLEPSVAPEGVVVWHVKQDEDGVSFLLSPVKLPFDEFAGSRNVASGVPGTT